MPGFFIAKKDKRLRATGDIHLRSTRDIAGICRLRPWPNNGSGLDHSDPCFHTGNIGKNNGFSPIYSIHVTLLPVGRITYSDKGIGSNFTGYNN